MPVLGNAWQPCKVTPINQDFSAPASLLPVCKHDSKLTTAILPPAPVTAPVTSVLRWSAVMYSRPFTVCNRSSPRSPHSCSLFTSSTTFLSDSFTYKRTFCLYVRCCTCVYSRYDQPSLKAALCYHDCQLTVVFFSCADCRAACKSSSEKSSMITPRRRS